MKLHEGTYLAMPKTTILMHMTKQYICGWVLYHPLLILEILARAAKGAGAFIFGAVFQGILFSHGSPYCDKEFHDLMVRLSESIFYVDNMQDQEVLEARRACDEKEDRLRDARASAAALKEELQILKRSRSVQISGVKPGPSYFQDDEDDEMISACDDRQLEVIQANANAQSKKREQGQETWATPWETEKPQNVAAHEAATSKEFLDATVLKARTVDDGILSSYQRF